MRIFICILSVYFLFVPESFSYQKDLDKATLLTQKDSFQVSEKIVLKFKGVRSTSALMQCSGSYGTILITPKLQDNLAMYEIPKMISTKRGTVNWSLSHKDSWLKGSFYIRPLADVKTMETYLGPPSILAGGSDFSMFVSIPVDSLDNPMMDGSTIKLSTNFENIGSQFSDAIENLVSYRNIYSPSKSGRLLITSSYKEQNSKEFTLMVYPSTPENFSISFTRPNDFADGNQITTFQTSAIKDKFGNIVNDGTYVEFLIRTDKNMILKTSGTTIGGMAKGKMIHPFSKAKWQVKAYIEGMAESNLLRLNYQQSINNLSFSLRDKNRKIHVGPIKSFMGQLVPDGLEINLFLFKDKKLIHQEMKTSYNGETYFILEPDIIPPGTYTLKITAAGLDKYEKNLMLW